MPRPHQTALVLVTALCLALPLAGCGGGDDPGPAGPTLAGSSPHPADPGRDESQSAPEAKGRPLPSVAVSQVVPLVGRWVSDAPQRDYFQFKPDGSASWMSRGHQLWSGQVIPEGGGKFRFSWEGQDPEEASYWGVTVAGDGRTLVFGGTNQTYTRAKP